jgi:hypothetical protein
VGEDKGADTRDPSASHKHEIAFVPMLVRVRRELT